jgi:hypothetical protein
MATQKRVIDVDWYDNLGLILKVQSGVFYTSQVAGYACQHPEVEGVFYPLRVEPGKAELFSLQQHFRGSWSHIDEADADLIDGVLRKNGHHNLSVDRAKLDDSYEAWVHLVVMTGLEDISGFGDCEAVLVWPNSD